MSEEVEDDPWEDGTLGASEEYVKVPDYVDDEAIDEALGFNQKNEE